MKLFERVTDQGHHRLRGLASMLPAARLRGTAWTGGALVAVALAACHAAVGDSGSGAGGGSGGSGPGGGGGNSATGGGNGGGGGGSGSGAVTGVGGPGATAATTGPCTGLVGLTSRRARRLSEREYANVVNDLLGSAAQQQVLAAWPQEPTTVGAFDTQGPLVMLAAITEAVSNLAAQLAAAANPTTLAPCATAGGSAACLQTFIQSFATKAYGRPPTAAELTAATTLAAQGQDYATSVRLIVEMVLQSPSTLYISELGPTTLTTASTQPVPLTPYEIASQVSFFTTGSRPDATLLQAAQAGLQSASDIQAQVTRLMATPAGQASLPRFITGWIEMGPMSTVPKNQTVYPQYTAAVAAAMQQEYDQFVATQLNGGNGTLSALLTATSTNVPAALAPIYGSDLLASGLDTNHRKGILSLPAVLTFTSSDVSSGPVQRGLLIRRGLFCQVVAGPPASLQAQIAAMPIPTDAVSTTRKKFEDHVVNPVCSGCHNVFDPMGFGLEDMDGLGRFRTTENGLAVDSSGQLQGTDVDGNFEGPAQLSVKLSQSAEVASCMVSHFFSFAQARDVAPADQCVVQDWANSFAQGGGKINSLVAAYVAHRDFAYREDDR